MTSPKTDDPRSALQRLGSNLANLFGGQGAADELADRDASRAEGRHVVPSHVTIEDVMERDLVTVLPETLLRDAVHIMIENRISSVPVVNAQGSISGALNEGDLMKVFYEPHRTHVQDVMTRDPIVVAIGAPLLDVIDELMSSRFRRVLIHDGGRLVGVITRSHVMPALLEALEVEANSALRQ